MKVRPFQPLVLLISFLVIALAAGCTDNPKPAVSAAPETVVPSLSPSASEVAPRPNVYQNAQLGFELTFPESWADKYEITETDEGIQVVYVPQNKDIEKANLFGISSWGTEAEWDDWWESGGKDVGAPIEKITVVKGKVLVQDGPTEFIYKGNDQAKPDSDQYAKMLSEVSDIIGTLKPLVNG